MGSRVGQQGALDLSLPDDVEGGATRFSTSPAERAALTRQIIAAVEPFDLPYASKTSRYIVTDDDEYGEFFELWRPTRNSRCFPSRALRRNIETFDQFMAFAKGQDTTNWRFWCIKLPGKKAPLGALFDEVNRFNKAINTRFTELRKKKIFEPLLVGLHIRYAPTEDAFDLHLHVICRIDPARHDEIFKQLGNRFSKADVRVDEPIRNLEASVTYLLWGIIPHKELATWRRQVLEPVWRLSLTKAQLMRPCGSFRAWRSQQAQRRAQSKPTKEQLQELRAVKAEERAKVMCNRAETAYPGPNGARDRCLGRIKFTSPIDGRQRTGRLYERALPPTSTVVPAGVPTAEPSKRSGIAPARLTKSSASVTTIQGPREGHIEGHIERGRQPQAWWWRVWSYGTPGTAGRLPGPIRRRLAQCQVGVRPVAGSTAARRIGLGETARSRRLRARLSSEGAPAHTMDVEEGALASWSDPSCPDWRPIVSHGVLGGALRGDRSRLPPLAPLACCTRFLDPLAQGLRPFREHHHPQAPEPAQMLAGE